MVSDSWYMEIESNIFTLLQYILVKKDDAPFPELNCTTSSQNESVETLKPSKTSTIRVQPTRNYREWVHSVKFTLDEKENKSIQPKTLYNKEITAVRATFELQVYSDKSEAECRKIMTRCIQEMKEMRFNVSMFPDPQTVNKKYFAISRFTRIVASGDADIVQKV